MNLPFSERPSFASRVQHRVAVLEAMAALTVSMLAVKFCFRRIAPWAMRAVAVSEAPPGDVRRRVRNSLARASKWLPWKPVCLPRAVAAKWMLERRGYASTIRLGVGGREEGLHAHAWLDAGGEILVGGEGADGLRTFAHRAGPTA